MNTVLVPGDGPFPCNGMLIGQGPGEQEVKADPPAPFIGPAGNEQDEYLAQVGLHRSQLYLTNAFKYYLEGNERPTLAQLEDHLPMLLQEIHMVQPRVIGGVGDCASEWISRLAGQRWRDIGSEHGIPRWVEVDGHKCILVPLTHPAAGLYAPEAMGTIFSDYQVFAKVLRGEVHVSDLPQTGKVFSLDITSPQKLSAALMDLHSGTCIAMDTEGDKEIPWGLTFSLDGMFGYRIGAENPDLLEYFNLIIRHQAATVILQNSPHDIPVLLSMGVDVRDLPIIDTMVMAYLLCVEPQGLKDLGWRWCRVWMEEYGELADPVTEKKTRKYLEKAAEIDWDECPVCHEPGLVGRKHFDQVCPTRWITEDERLVNGLPPFNYQGLMNDTGMYCKSVICTPKGNIKKQFLPYVNWCKGGEKSYPQAPLNKRIKRILNGEHNGTADPPHEL